ncbi:hypothetical protein N658DRAFT_492794 [Parathielavia hyrcaniae]|uniref:Translation initiation factor IF-3 n=1 Tax=Parathielavia hyrcaniae TaxID=113614 RepID=A0AAN6QC05_9PEZI|nr:hypothetical protein N658DRAFT_492794 [Parathielavia hyrcaniae]
MKTSKCLFNSAAALRKVFVGNAAVSEAPWKLQRLLLPAIAVAIKATPSTPLQRPFSTHPIAQLRYKRVTPVGSRDPAPSTDRFVCDYGIAYPWIQLRQEDGRLSEPQRTSQVLKDINLERDMLILLAVPKADPLSSGPQYPICRIADREAEEKARSSRQPDKSAGKKKTKELELNWAIAPHDLRTKMTQLKRFLSKGHQVLVTMMNAKERKKRKASADEAKLALKAVEATIAEVPGAKEIRPREGLVGDTLTLHLHAPAGSVAAASAEPAAAGSPGQAIPRAPAAVERPEGERGVDTAV